MAEEIYFGESDYVGTVATIPLVPESSLKHDDYGYTYNNGPFMVMESMLWDKTVVTVKRLHREPPEGGNIDLLVTENEYMSKLHHPNILTLMGMCHTMNLENLVLLFETVTCGSLYAYLHQRVETMNIYNTCEIMKQIGEAVVFLHQQNFLHCYITSHAVQLITPSLAKLGNFEYMIENVGHPRGVGPQSKVVDNKYRNAAYNWMAPEVMDGHCITQLSDLYSLCVVLWEILHGTPPWPGMSAQLIKDELILEKVGLVVDSKITEPFSSLLRIGLKLEPAARKFTVEYFKDVMAQVLVDGDTSYSRYGREAPRDSTGSSQNTSYNTDDDSYQDNRKPDNYRQNYASPAPVSEQGSSKRSQQRYTPEISGVAVIDSTERSEAQDDVDDSYEFIQNPAKREFFLQSHSRSDLETDSKRNDSVSDNGKPNGNNNQTDSDPEAGPSNPFKEYYKTTNTEEIKSMVSKLPTSSSSTSLITHQTKDDGDDARNKSTIYGTLMREYLAPAPPSKTAYGFVRKTASPRPTHLVSTGPALYVSPTTAELVKPLSQSAPCKEGRVKIGQFSFSDIKQQVPDWKRSLVVAPTERHSGVGSRSSWSCSASPGAVRSVDIKPASHRVPLDTSPAHPSDSPVTQHSFSKPTTDPTPTHTSLTTEQQLSLLLQAKTNSSSYNRSDSAIDTEQQIPASPTKVVEVDQDRTPEGVSPRANMQQWYGGRGGIRNLIYSFQEQAEEHQKKQAILCIKNKTLPVATRTSFSADAITTSLPSQARQHRSWYHMEGPQPGDRGPPSPGEIDQHRGQAYMSSSKQARKSYSESHTARRQQIDDETDEEVNKIVSAALRSAFVEVLDEYTHPECEHKEDSFRRFISVHQCRISPKRSDFTRDSSFETLYNRMPSTATTPVKSPHGRPKSWNEITEFYFDDVINPDLCKEKHMRLQSTVSVDMSGAACQSKDTVSNGLSPITANRKSWDKVPTPVEKPVEDIAVIEHTGESTFMQMKALDVKPLETDISCEGFLAGEMEGNWETSTPVSSTKRP